VGKLRHSAHLFAHPTGVASAPSRRLASVFVRSRPREKSFVLWKLLEARGRIELPNKGFADLCLTTWLPRRSGWKGVHRHDNTTMMPGDIGRPTLVDKVHLRQPLLRLFHRFSSSDHFELTEALFSRALGFIYLTAFGSLALQIKGLIGSHGIAPAAQLMTSLREQLGRIAWWDLPSLLWLSPTDGALVGSCILGSLAAVVLMTGFYSRWAAITCWVLYLSLVSIGQPFMGFQWDALLLEAGFLAFFAGAPILVWGYRFLLFRLMFESGIVKLSSHDPNWRNFHALRFHFYTQPLPSPIAYYAAHLPSGVLDFVTAATLVTELAAPLLLFGPRRVRYAGTGILAGLQIIILLTGNYAFFNLLTLALCLWGLDDRAFKRVSGFLKHRISPVVNPYSRRVTTGLVGILIAIGAAQLLDMLTGRALRTVAGAFEIIAPLEIVNTYGLFAVMTTSRPEIILEGSDDGTNWREYSFPYKPGNLHRGLPVVAPYQPRLDWQMWFAALGSYGESRWFQALAYRLLVGEREVIGLLDTPPFAKPPRYMRALLYDYEFTPAPERARTGAIWKRQLRGVWFGPVSLKQQ
jgi:hypothetical protein